MKHRELFQLFSNCRIVAGFSRSTICDLQRRKMHFIPNSLAALFINDRELPYNDLLPTLTPEEKTVFETYIDLLVKEDLGFFTSWEARASFPPISMEWDYPASITNCILDAKDEIPYFDISFSAQLDQLGCYHLQFRFFSSPALQHIQQLIKQVNESEIRSVEIVLAEGSRATYCGELLDLTKDQKKIRSIIVHSASGNEILREAPHNYGLVIKVTAAITSDAHCGIVDTGYFQTNISHFTESLHHNTCLNRKISIDTEGNIKNCPSMKESFGNIRDTTLAEALNKPGFKKYWDITKDQISVCKDCEFRHVCTDCRAYVENPDDDYSKPLKCGYDPYTCTWEEWSTHPMKQKAIDHYRMRNLVNRN